MLKIINLVVMGFIAGVLITTVLQLIRIKLRGLFFLLNREEVEQWDWMKFIRGITVVNDPARWGQDLHDLFNIRKIIIVGVIIGIIYGVGWFMGIQSKPVYLNVQGKEVTIKLNEHFLRIDKLGNTTVVDKDGKVLKVIRVRDIPELQKALRPYGLKIAYFATIGEGVGTTLQLEGGLGVQTFKYYRWYLNHFLTNKGIYPVGLSYQLTENFDIMLGFGMGYKEQSSRVGIFGKWRF